LRAGVSKRPPWSKPGGSLTVRLACGSTAWLEEEDGLEARWQTCSLFPPFALVQRPVLTGGNRGNGEAFQVLEASDNIGIIEPVPFPVQLHIFRPHGPAAEPRNQQDALRDETPQDPSPRHLKNCHRLYPVARSTSLGDARTESTSARFRRVRTNHPDTYLRPLVSRYCTYPL
jgi:hypothetical protein